MNCECSELIILWFVIVLKSGGVDRTVKPVMFTSAALRLIKKGEAIVLVKSRLWGMLVNVSFYCESCSSCFISVEGQKQSTEAAGSDGSDITPCLWRSYKKNCYITASLSASQLHFCNICTRDRTMPAKCGCT